MESSERARVFLQELWEDIDSDDIWSNISTRQYEMLVDALDTMSEWDGKPAAHFVIELYDSLMQTPETAVHCHNMMWFRILTSTAWVRDRLHDGEEVFDLGSCTGHQVLFWAKELPGSRFTGIDVSRNALTIADQWKDSLGLDNVEFRVDNYLRPDLDEGADTLDTIVNCFTMETLPEHLAVRCFLQDWMLKSLKPEGRLVAVLTVPNWTILSQIVDQWRSQGLRLNEIEMIPTGDGSAHPGVVMSRIGEDLQLDIRDWAKGEAARRIGSLWIIYNPVDEEGYSSDPFEHFHEDLHRLVALCAWPMRLETWSGDAPQINVDTRPATWGRPVLELHHPDWEIDSNPLSLWLDWHEVEGEPEPRYEVRLLDCPDPDEELSQKLAELNTKVAQSLPEMEEEVREAPIGRLCDYIEAVNEAS
jgi:ubiquinone/menaquinone biosynthesis C-methylase UbiE